MWMHVDFIRLLWREQRVNAKTQGTGWKQNPVSSVPKGQMLSPQSYWNPMAVGAADNLTQLVAAAVFPSTSYMSSPIAIITVDTGLTFHGDLLLEYGLHCHTMPGNVFIHMIMRPIKNL